MAPLRARPAPPPRRLRMKLELQVSVNFSARRSSTTAAPPAHGARVHGFIRLHRVPVQHHRCAACAWSGGPCVSTFHTVHPLLQLA